MNKQLKFSWGHIVAFIALIWISYVSFIGITYKTDGNFHSAVMGVIIIDIVLLLVFIGGQLIKSTNKHFKTWIVIERILVVLSPIIFTFMMVPYMHFWTVHKNAEEIETQFNQSLEESKSLFVNYELYANHRIDNYDRMLNGVIRNKNTKFDEYKEFGFTTESSFVKKNNKVEALRLQLLSANYDNLKNAAIKWIDDASGASVWNVFLIGNVKQIDRSFEKWHLMLVEFSENKLSDEEYKGYNQVYVFDEDSKTIQKAKDCLNGLHELFTKEGVPSILVILSLVVIYILLSLPYIIQYRFSKSTYGFFSNNVREKKVQNIDPEQDPDDEEDEYTPFWM